MLSVWCEELGRLLLLRHQKSRTPDSGKNCASSGMQMPQMQKPNMPPMAPSEPGGMQWQQGQHPAGQSLSVVTTVWGLSQTTQSGPFIQNTNGSGPGFTNTSMSTTPYSQPGQPYPAGAGGPGPMGKGAAGHMYPGNNPQQQVPPGPAGPMHQNPYNRPSSAPYNRPNGYPPTPTTPGTNPANGGPPPEALSAAALVAAAATATATATATAVMGMQERQQQQQQQQQQPQMNMNVNMNMNNQYPPQMSHQSYQQGFPGQQGRPPSHNPINMNMNMNMNMNHGPHPGGAGGPGMSAMGAQMSGAHGPMAGMQGMQGPMGGKMMGMYGGGQRRMTPYPSPQQYMQNKRQQFPGPQQQFPSQQQLIRGQRPQLPQLPNNNTKQVGYGPQYGSSAPQGYVGGKPVYPPTQQPLPSPTFGPGQRGPAPPYNQQNPYMNPHQMNPQAFNRQPGPNPAAYNNQFQQQQHSQQQSYQQNHNMMYGQHSPLPGNPTPPMTPGSSVPPYLSPGSQDIKPNPAELKPMLMRKENDELRLTFPVRDGVVLPPFRLEHNLAVSNHIFHLRESVFQTLMWRSDLELQLKCFHHEDRQMNTNWPASVTVSVNATPLHIERGENKTCHKPLYLKEVCAPGRNTIQITVTACCCSHLFVLQLVHRPSVRSVLQGLLRKRLLPAEHCITKIKRNFSNVAGNNTNNHLSGSGEDSVEQTAVKMSLKCPITFRRIVLPARGHECKHIQCFDLESYLQLNCERGSWRCPVCNKTALLEGLEIDQYIWGILHSLANTDFEEVTIDQTASWKPVTGKPIKEEESDSCGSRWVKAMSPSSMTLPTMSSWDGFYNSQHNPQQQQPGTPQGPQGRPPMPNSQGNNNGMNHYNFDGSGAGGSLPDTNFQSAASDFLSPLSQMSENLGGSNSNIQKAMTPGSADTQHHSNSHSSNGPGSIEGQPLRHPTPAPGTPGSATPSSQANLTNQSMSPACNSQPMGGAAASGASNQASTPNNHHPASNNSTGDNNTSNHSQLATHNDLSSDLNFDPEAIIEGEGQGQESLDLLPENIGDPMELLSYLGPPDGSNANSNTDDLLSLFDT